MFDRLQNKSWLNGDQRKFRKTMIIALTSTNFIDVMSRIPAWLN